MDDSNKSHVSGVVNYDWPGRAPADWKLIIELRDTTSQDAPSMLIERLPMEGLGQPPHNFQLIYNPRSVGESNTYSLQAEIRDGNHQLLFVNDTAYEVITRGNPRRVSIELVAPQAGQRIVAATETNAALNGRQKQSSTNPASEVSGAATTAQVETSAPTRPEIPDANEATGGNGWGATIALLAIVVLIVVVVVRKRLAANDDDSGQA